MITIITTYSCDLCKKAVPDKTSLTKVVVLQKGVPLVSIATIRGAVASKDCCPSCITTITDILAI